MNPRKPSKKTRAEMRAGAARVKAYEDDPNVVKPNQVELDALIANSYFTNGAAGDYYRVIKLHKQLGEALTSLMTRLIPILKEIDNRKLQSKE